MACEKYTGADKRRVMAMINSERLSLKAIAARTGVHFETIRNWSKEAAAVRGRRREPKININGKRLGGAK